MVNKPTFVYKATQRLYIYKREAPSVPVITIGSEEFPTSSFVVPAQAQVRFSGSKKACLAYLAHH